MKQPVSPNRFYERRRRASRHLAWGDWGVFGCTEKTLKDRLHHASCNLETFQVRALGSDDYVARERMAGFAPWGRWFKVGDPAKYAIKVKHQPRLYEVKRGAPLSPLPAAVSADPYSEGYMARRRWDGGTFTDWYALPNKDVAHAKITAACAPDNYQIMRIQKEPEMANPYIHFDETIVAPAAEWEYRITTDETGTDWVTVGAGMLPMLQDLVKAYPEKYRLRRLHSNITKHEIVAALLACGAVQGGTTSRDNPYNFTSRTPESTTATIDLLCNLLGVIE